MRPAQTEGQALNKWSERGKAITHMRYGTNGTPRRRDVDALTREADRTVASELREAQSRKAEARSASDSPSTPWSTSGRKNRLGG